MATNFYRTNEEKMLAKVVDRFYEDEIECNENALQDGDSYTAWTEPDFINYVVEEVLKEQKYLRLSWANHIVLEAKHIRFMGAERVREIVTHRIQYLHNKDGQWMWEQK